MTTMENPFVGNDASRLSMREDAQRRAMSMATSPCTSDLGSSEVTNSDQSAIPASPHPLLEEQQSFATTPPDNNMALQARKEWRQHGEGLTQVLEDKRHQRHHHHHPHQQQQQQQQQQQTEQQQQILLRRDGGGGGLMRKPGALVVRVLSAEKRVDLSGSNYTAYVIRVQFANPSTTPENSSNNNTNNNSGSSISNLVEHRYSEFAKINALFKKHEIVLDRNASFPAKHWAGRVGNWTPSLTWAPEKHDELINYRVIQLDCWLVHVVNMYNDGILPGEVAQALYEFLVAPSKPPCENNNELEGSAKWKWNNPISFTLGSGIRQATQTVQYMCQDPYKLNQSDHSIPLDLLHAAKGLCFMTVVKAGLMVSGRIGTGLLVARMSNNNANGWSAPVALGTVGLGWGALMGADVTHYLIVLTTTKAVEDFCGATSLQLGAEMGMAVGPIGRGANSHLATGDWTLHPAYAYAHSQGLFVGMSLEGSVVSVRHDVNAKFYGQQVSSQALLSTPGPKAAEPLYQALDRAMLEQIPDEGFRPSTLWTANPNGYENHPNRPIYTNHQQSPMPPPIMPGGQSFCFGSSSAVGTPPQQAGSGSMESYHQQSFVLPGPGRMQQQPHLQQHFQHQQQQYLTPQPQQQPFQQPSPRTIETMNPGPQPLFDPTSPGSTVGSNSHQWY